ncbi:MAG TPA: hypothetical protein VN744_07285 [Casimicrobiaceae bacterium]|nr:hypothetical protein [Casimicrobiaceae bacterium]
MIRSCIRQAVRVFAGAALLACAITAQAANITISAANCASYSTTTDQGGNVTITCVPANGTGPLTGCSISGPATGTIGTPVTLQAVCAGGAPATNWTWAGGNCNGTADRCSAVENSAVTQTYQVTIHNGAGADQTPTTQVAWSATPPAKPTGCSITPTPSSLPATGGPVSLTAQCTGGGAVATWTWGGATYTTQSGNTASATISSTTTFTATAANAGGSSIASTTVQVGSSGAWPAQCSGFNSTSAYDSPWGNWIKNQNGALGPGQAVVIRFTTGSETSSTVGSFVASNGNFIATHDATLSTQPCDFSSTGQNSVIKSKTAQGMTISFTIGGGGNLVLAPNSTYYLNIRLNSGAVCSGTDCDYGVMNLLKPPGM